jgi:hypothetical protein
MRWLWGFSRKVNSKSGVPDTQRKPQCDVAPAGTYGIIRQKGRSPDDIGDMVCQRKRTGENSWVWSNRGLNGPRDPRSLTAMMFAQESWIRSKAHHREKRKRAKYVETTRGLVRRWILPRVVLLPLLCYAALHCLLS